FNPQSLSYTRKEGHCKANGMIMYDKAVWSPKPCVICMCSNGNVACDEMSCATLNCSRTAVAAGECCPHCTYMGNPASLPSHRLEIKSEEYLEEIRNRARIEEDEYEVDEEEEDEYEEEEDEEEEGFSGYPLFPSILDSDLYDTDDEIVPFSLPVGCDISDVIMNCHNARLTQIPPLHIPELKSLNLEGNAITTITADAFSGIPNLEWIDLSRNKILSSNIHPTAFRKLKKLKRLHMDGNLLQHISTELPLTLLELKLNENRLEWLDEESFHDLNNLVTLELEGNNISEINVAPTAFTPCKKLIYLRLGRNRFRTVPQGLPPSLQELYLENNEIEEISEAVFNKTTNLNMIVLRNNKLDESRIAPLAWMNLENLEALDLSHNRIVHVPSFLPRGLIHLVLIYNQIERIPGFVFAHLEPGLEYLYLSANKLTSDGIDPTSFFGTYNTLRELFLDHNKLVTIPFGLADMKALHFLRLNDNLIRTVPLESICNENDQEDSNIVVLRLENNYINRRKIPPTAFSCIQSYSSVVLRPQKVKH
uniref:Extracellular matrix protein 2 n=1 Tax=Callorhinchus milii TaxID=7868 RepID=A0A4W3HU63_CALMI